MKLIKLKVKSYADLTKQDKIDIIDRYYEGIPFKDIAPLLNVSGRAVPRVLKDAGINTMRRNRYTLNEGYFDNINTEAKAYILGFIYADGFVGNEDFNNIVVSVTYPDKCLLEKIVKELEFTGKIRKTVNGGGFCNGTPSAVLNFSSPQMAADLRKIGLYPNKSLTLKSIINREYVPNSLIRHLIRGYFDGDGFIHSSNSTTYHTLKSGEVKKYIYKSHVFGVSGTVSVLNEIKPYLRLDTEIKNSVTEEVKYLRGYSINDLQYIYKYMYKDATIYLDRKYKKWQEVISDISK